MPPSPSIDVTQSTRIVLEKCAQANTLTVQLAGDSRTHGVLPADILPSCVRIRVPADYPAMGSGVVARGWLSWGGEAFTFFTRVVAAAAGSIDLAMPMQIQPVERRRAARQPVANDPRIRFLDAEGRSLAVFDVSETGIRIVVPAHRRAMIEVSGVRGTLVVNAQAEPGEETPTSPLDAAPTGETFAVILEARHAHKVVASARGHAVVGCRFVGMGDAQRERLKEALAKALLTRSTPVV